jgi:hypothetical protein
MLHLFIGADGQRHDPMIPVWYQHWVVPQHSSLTNDLGHSGASTVYAADRRNQLHRYPRGPRVPADRYLRSTRAVTTSACEPACDLTDRANESSILQDRLPLHPTAHVTLVRFHKVS